jgi:hypothetical protein
VSIVSSVIESTLLQKDGRSWVHEIHTDQIGAKYDRNYLANAGVDTAAALAAYATQLTSDIQAREIAKNIADVATNGSLASPTTIYSTAAQNFTALRAAYQFATQVQAIMIGDFLNTLTDLQLQNAFSITAGQVTTLRTNKLVPAASAASTIRASAGQ